METAIYAERRVNPAILSASSKFSKFKPEPMQESRSVRGIGTDSALESMKAAWKGIGDAGTLDERYAETVRALAPVMERGYSAKDVERFCFQMAELQDRQDFAWKAGLILSALMNNCQDTRFVIRTMHLTSPINFLGFNNTNEIIVEGSVGYAVCWGMIGGSVCVEGSAGDSAGREMNGGRITVRGDIGKQCGVEMKNGSIFVTANALDSVGEGMKGGSIIVAGDAGNRTGHGMSGGIICVGRNAGDEVGVSMYNGRIIVRGNAGDFVGKGMSRGIIAVEGDAGRRVGECMEGGEIHVRGDLASLACGTAGRVFHKGRQIFDA